MGFLDKLNLKKRRRQATDVAADHGDKITDGVDKATDFVDDKTGGKHTDKLEQVDEKAADAIDKLASEGGDADDDPAGN